MTRAGYTGNMNTNVLQGKTFEGADWSKANAQNRGFGVFAYFTGKSTYEDFRKGTAADDGKPNFMYNQLVWYNDANPSSLTKWEYSPIKYWPNDFTEGAVDNQEKNQSNATATGSTTYGGNVSFFAYAPYVSLTQSNAAGQTGATPATATYGIVAVSGNEYRGDPYVKYVIPTPAGPMVDLLWGTKGGTTLNVLNTGNTGIKGDNTNAKGSDDYEKAILDQNVMNADLTKQTTTGRIDMLFKHALTKVGGSYAGSDVGDDENPSTATNGLMIILDIDKEGKETGGLLESASGIAAIYDASQTPYMSKVTVKSISIKTKMLTKDASDKAPGEVGYVSTWAKNDGLFDLATGQWTLTTTTIETEATEFNHYILQEGVSMYGDEDVTVSGTLSDKITEPTTVANGAAGFKVLPIGVTNVPKNVYKSEANPMVFFPNTYPEMVIAVDYIVRTYDPNLAKGYSDVEQIITKTLTFGEETKLNKKYNILIHLGLTSVKFTATVSNWDTTDVDPEVSSDPYTGEEVITYESDENVYVPKNVEAKVKTLTVDQTSFDPTGWTIAEVPAAGGTFNITATATLETDADNTPMTYSSIDVHDKAGYVCDADWVSITPDGKVTIAENSIPAEKGRKATVYVTYGDVTGSFEIKQYAEKVTAVNMQTNTNDNITSIALTGEAGTWTYDHVAYTVATYDASGNVVGTPASKTTTAADAALILQTSADWITASANKLQYNYNITGSDRTIYVKARYRGAESKSVIEITQSTASLKEVKDVNMSGTTFSADGGTVYVNNVTVTYTGGTDFDVTVPGTSTSIAYTQGGGVLVLTLPGSGSGKNDIKVTAPNPDPTPKTGTLTVTYTPATGAGSGSKAKDVTLTQSGK